MESQTKELCRLVSSNLIMTPDTILAVIRHNLILSHSQHHPGGITNMRFDLVKKLLLLKENFLLQFTSWVDAVIFVFRQESNIS